MVRVTKFRRSNGVWYARYWLDGRRCAESARTQSESAAESYRLRREMELNAGIQPVRYSDVEGLAKRYLGGQPVDVSPSHRREALRCLRVFLRICGRKRADGSYHLSTGQLIPEIIDRFVLRRRQVRMYDGTQRDSRGRKVVRYHPASNVTLRKELRYLSSFFNWCCRQRPPYLRENPIPLSNASSVKDDAKPHFMVTEDELRALLGVCQTARQYLFIMLAWWTGARRSELLGLHFYHFDFQGRTVQMAHGKNRMYGILPVAPEILDAVKGLYAGAGEADPLFPKDPFPWHGFAGLCKKAGVRHHRFHDLRISASMRIRSGGFDAGIAGQWVGNTRETNLRYYTDLTAVGTRIGSLLRVEGLPPVPPQTA